MPKREGRNYLMRASGRIRFLTQDDAYVPNLMFICKCGCFYTLSTRPNSSPKLEEQLRDSCGGCYQRFLSDNVITRLVSLYRLVGPDEFEDLIQSSTWYLGIFKQPEQATW